MPNRIAILISAALLLILALIPVLSVQIPPLSDYPNHMARMHILADGGQNPFLREYYAIHWDLLPNLAMDLIVPPLLSILSPESAGRLFIGWLFAGLMSGTIALHYALHRRWSPWPLLGYFFLYNSVFLWGFLNYLFGLSLALPAIALWLLLRNRPAALVIPLFSCITIILFFAHLFAFGVWAMIVLSYEGNHWWRDRQTGTPHEAHLFWKVVPPLALPLLLLTLSPTFRPTTPSDYPNWLRGAPPRPSITFAPLNTRLEALKGTIRTPQTNLDRVTAVLLFGLVGTGLALRQCRILPSMYLPLAVTAAVALAMPSTIGSTGLAEIRMPIVFLLLLVAASDWSTLRRRWLIPVALALIALFVIRLGVITEHWRETDRHYRQFLEALDHVPEGSRLFSGLVRPDVNSAMEGSEPDPMPMNALTCWGIIRRSLFVSNLFSAPGQQPVRLTTAYRQMLTAEEFIAQSRPLPWDQIGTDYDFVVVRKGHRFARTIPATFTATESGEMFQFYRTPRRESATPGTERLGGAVTGILLSR